MRKISEIVRHRDPVVLPQEATVQQACSRMKNRGVGAVLVTDKHGSLVGIFTGRDAIARVLAEGRDGASTKLSSVMTRQPHTLKPSNTAIDALRLMHECGFRHVPVVKDGKLLGVVSRGDFRGLEQDRLDEETVLWERV